jgi:hypothetical protein
VGSSAFTGLAAGILGGDLFFTGLALGLPAGILGGDECLTAGILGGDLARLGSFLLGLNDGLGTVGSDPVGVLVVGGTDGRSVGARGAEVGAGGDKGVMETAAGKSTVVGVGLQALVGFAVGVAHVVVCSLVTNEFVAEIDVHKAAIRTGRRVLIFGLERLVSQGFGGNLKIEELDVIRLLFYRLGKIRF